MALSCRIPECTGQRVETAINWEESWFGRLMKGEKVHKTPNYDAEMKLCFFSLGCFAVPCTRLILGITLCCSRQSLNPEHVKGIEPSSLGNQSHTWGLSTSPAPQILKRRLAKKGCTVACTVHPNPHIPGSRKSLSTPSAETPCSVPFLRGPWGGSSAMELGMLLWVLLGEQGFGVSTSTQSLPFSIPRGLLGKGDESWQR